MIDLRLGDCLEIMPTLAAQSFDAIIADIPYGTTACKWDMVIPFAPMWAELKRLAKPKAAIVLFGSQPFTSALVMSNAEMFKYELIWNKLVGTSAGLARIRPMPAHENVLIFGDSKLTYMPQMREGFKAWKKRDSGNSIKNEHRYGTGIKPYLKTGTTQRYPISIIEMMQESKLHWGASVHPTQKPVALMEYLIRTYTNEGDAVLDFTMGSGTTMVACVNTKRNGTGIEKDAGYYAIAERRIQEAQAQMSMPMVTA